MNHVHRKVTKGLNHKALIIAILITFMNGGHMGEWRRLQGADSLIFHHCWKWGWITRWLWAFFFYWNHQFLNSCSFNSFKAVVHEVHANKHTEIFIFYAIFNIRWWSIGPWLFLNRSFRRWFQVVGSSTWSVKLLSLRLVALSHFLWEIVLNFDKPLNIPTNCG